MCAHKKKKGEPPKKRETESERSNARRQRCSSSYNRFVAAVVVVAALLFAKIASEEFVHLSQHDAIDARQGCVEWDLCQRATVDERATIAERCEHDRHRCERSYVAYDIVRAMHNTLYKMLPASLASFVDTVTSSTLLYSVALVLVASLVVLWCVFDGIIQRYFQSHLRLPHNKADIEDRKKME